MRLFNYLLTATILMGTVAGPALADPHHGWHGNNNHRGKHWRKKYRKAMRRNFNNWNDERSYYLSRWNSPNAAARARYDAQMRENWLRYKNNNWNGNYSWSTYNDPRFIDYLHNNNPSLLTNIRSIIGF